MNPQDLITALVRAINSGDNEALIALFSRQSSVRDGGLWYTGPTAIKHWIRDCIERYSLSLEILTVSGEDRSWLFEALVSGTFEGSPVRVEHRVTILGEKIANLDI